MIMEVVIIINKMSKLLFIVCLVLALGYSSSKDMSLTSLSELANDVLQNGALGQVSAFGTIACLAGITGVLNSGFMLFDMFTYKEFIPDFSYYGFFFHIYGLVFNFLIMGACQAI